MRRIAIIPARGGSKRLPRKNILDFMGKPIISWTIEAAKKTGLFEDVVVSTEDEEIAAIAEEYGARIDKRSVDLATDTASVRDVCYDFLEREEKAGRSYDVMTVLYATAPLRTVEDIKNTVNLVEPGVHDFALAVTHYDLPPHQALKREGKDHTVTPMFPDIVNEKASDVGELVVDNGSTYAVSVDAFKKERSFYGPNLQVHTMPRERSQDIDEAVDLDIARFFAERLSSQKGAA